MEVCAYPPFLILLRGTFWSKKCRFYSTTATSLAATAASNSCWSCLELDVTHCDKPRYHLQIPALRSILILPRNYEQYEQNWPKNRSLRDPACDGGGWAAASNHHLLEPSWQG